MTRRSGIQAWSLRALCLLAMGFVGAASIHADNIMITGVMVAFPSDPTDFGDGEPLFLAQANYKAIEFYTDVDIDGTELRKYAIRMTASGGTPSEANLNLENPVTAGSFFYAAATSNRFFDIYDIAWDDNSGEPNPVLTQAGPPTKDMIGIEKLELIYYPTGFDPGNPSAPRVILDVLGGFDPGDPPLSEWTYEDSWAYRKSATLADGTFNVNKWTFGGEFDLTNQTLAYTAAVVPFGTYSIVPEPSTMALFLAGLLSLRLMRRR